MRSFPLASSLRVSLAALAVACGTDVSEPNVPQPESTGAPPQVPTGMPPDAPPVVVPSAPKARHQGVAFVHGTSDNDGEPFACSGTGEDWYCGSPSGVGYWSQATIDSERTRADGSRRPFVAIGCRLRSLAPWRNPSPVKPMNGQPEPGSADCVSAEIATFLSGPDGAVGTDDDIDDLAIVTHSGGANVVRYILQQYSARTAFERIHAAARGVVAIAAPALGTYLADRVFGLGLLGVGNDILGIGYDDDGVDFIRTDKMKVFNADPAKFVDVSKNVAGVPVYVASGALADEGEDKDKIACGGETATRTLKLVNDVFFNTDDAETARNRCSDGFISCLSAMALANGDLSRVVFGKIDGKTIGKTQDRAHNQSRRSCDGLDLDIRAAVDAIFSTATTGALAPKSFGLSAVHERFVPLTRSVRHRSETAQGRIVDADARTDDVGVLVRITAETHGGKRLGVRATLVSEATGESWAVASAQQSIDVDPREGRAQFGLFLPTPAGMLAGERLVVRDVALVSHDDASTLDLMDRVVVER